MAARLTGLEAMLHGSGGGGGGGGGIEQQQGSGDTSYGYDRGTGGGGVWNRIARLEERFQAMLAEREEQNAVVATTAEQVTSALTAMREASGGTSGGSQAGDERVSLSVSSGSGGMTALDGNRPNLLNRPSSPSFLLNPQAAAAEARR